MLKEDPRVEWQEKLHKRFVCAPSPASLRAPEAKAMLGVQYLHRG